MKDLSEARRIVEQQRGEIERLQQEVTMLRQEYAADTVEIAKLNARLADVEAINSIDARFCDERILEIYEEAKANWNAQADQCNQWSDLGVDEVVTLVARAVEREILGGTQS